MDAYEWSKFLATLPEERQIEYSNLIDRLQTILAEDRSYILGELERRCRQVELKMRERGGDDGTR